MAIAVLAAVCSTVVLCQPTALADQRLAAYLCNVGDSPSSISIFARPSIHTTRPVDAKTPPTPTATVPDTKARPHLNSPAMETYTGHVRTPQDAIILFEACRIGQLPRVQRRLSEKERQQIKSGSVFVWDEREAGMRRWTDGKSWSASRVSGSFLTYREMEGKRGGSYPASAPAPKRTNAKSPDGSATGSDGEGPDGYRYKADGLMKQSFSITTSSGQHLHLISYFSRAQAPNLPQPTTDPQLRHIRPPKNMYPESSVNETQSVPAVTRGPMPGSPYAPSPHQPGPVSPYQRGGPAPQQVYTPGYPPTPSSTPPYAQYSYYPPQGQLPYGTVIYAQGPFPPQTHVLDGLPPHVRNPHPPYLLAHQPHPNFPGYPPHPAHLIPAAHPMHAVHQGHPGAPYNGNAPVRPMQGPEHGQQPQSNNYRQASSGFPAFPEQSVQLPAIGNGATSPTPRAENKPPTPQPAEPKSQAPLPVPESSGATHSASSARTAPSLTLGSILNNQDNDDDKGNQSNSRSGSRSPHSHRPIRETPADKIATNNSIAADTSAVNKLNRSMFVR